MKWNLIKLQYELLGVSPDQLAKDHGTSVQVIEYAIQEQGWSQENKQIVDATISSTEQYLKSFTILRQQVLCPQYLQLESTLLDRALEFAAAIDKESPTATRDLKSLAQILETLLRHNSLLVSQVKDKENEGNQITVQILNQIQ